MGCMHHNTLLFNVHVCSSSHWQVCEAEIRAHTTYTSYTHRHVHFFLLVFFDSISNLSNDFVDNMNVYKRPLNRKKNIHVSLQNNFNVSIFSNGI